MMRSVHGQVTLINGPNENETKVKISDRPLLGVALWITRLATKATTPLLSGKAIEHFRNNLFLGFEKKITESLSN